MASGGGSNARELQESLANSEAQLHQVNSLECVCTCVKAPIRYTLPSG